MGEAKYATVTLWTVGMWLFLAVFCLGWCDTLQANTTPYSLYVYPRPEFLPEVEHEQLLRLLKQRGWTLMSIPSRSPQEIHLSFRSVHSVLIQQGAHSRVFEIPSQYQNTLARIRSIVAFLELFTELEAPSPVQVTSLPVPTIPVRITHVPTNKGRKRSHHSEPNRKKRIRSQKKKIFRKKESRTIQQTQEPVPRKRISTNVQSAVGKQRMRQAREPTSRSNKQPQPKQPIKLALAKADTSPQLSVLGTKKKKEPEVRSWRGEFGLGLLLGLQGLPGIPLGAEVIGKIEWKRFSLALLVQLSSPVAVGDFSLVQLRPSLSLGYRIPLRNIRWVPEMGMLAEWMFLSYQSASTLALRWGAMAAMGVHIPIASQWWFVPKLTLVVFPQPYTFQWRSEVLYEARNWLLEFSLALYFRR